MLSRELDEAKQATAAASTRLSQETARLIQEKNAVSQELTALQAQARALQAAQEAARQKHAQEVAAANTQLKRVRDANRALAEATRLLLEPKAGE